MEVLISSFSSPGPNIFSLGPFNIRWYGLLIAMSVLIGLNLSKKLAAERGIKGSLINDLLPLLVLSSVIGARTYYVLLEWRNYTGEKFWSSIEVLYFNLPIPSAIEVWLGGIAIHGALIAGVLATIIFCKLKKLPLFDLLDILVPSVALGQAIGRWGNFFNNEAFGIPTNLPWKLFIPYFYRPEIFSNEQYFHPTFLYESIWNLIVFLLLLIVFKLMSTKTLDIPNGSIAFIYLITYSFGRFWIEGLRIDPLCISGLPPFCEGGFRIAQLISIILIGIGLMGLIWLYKEKKSHPINH